MAILEIERQDAVMVIRMNRPERMNALGTELRSALADAWCEFRDSEHAGSRDLHRHGRAFCAGEDMKESVERGVAGSPAALTEEGKPVRLGTLDKPVIVGDQRLRDGRRLHAGRARGSARRGARRDLRVVGSEALAARRLRSRHQGPPCRTRSRPKWRSRSASPPSGCTRWASSIALVEPDQLMPTAHEMAAHLLTLPPASRVNTTVMMRAMRPQASEELEELARGCTSTARRTT